jgi:hypothetical protein
MRTPYGIATQTDHKGVFLPVWLETGWLLLFLYFVFGYKNYMQNCSNMTFEILLLALSAHLM